ncbi:MAG TPA: AMP-binding protein, partial [Gemmatimonadaceae bacterium]|nr:AMP-binding protein [Gemmatimonadaceae bacterium]
VRDTLQLTADDSSLSFLPYCHAGERLFGLYTRILCGMRATLVPDLSALWEAQRAANATLFGGMPRFFEKVYEGLLAARGELAGEDAARWDRAVARGRERGRLRQAGGSVPAALDASWCDDRAVIALVLARYFGTRLRLATSGGAALPLEVAEYLDACGVTVLGAYGQTEHLCAAFNRPERYRHDAVGVAMPGTTIRIGEDGEVQLQRSALTFSGYHRRPEASRAAFTDDGEWLRTGDLGTLDADGFLRITGRIKELIALSNGKKVAPAPLEARLASGDLIAHAVVHGEGRPYLVALLALRWPLVERWQQARGIVATRRELVSHPALLAALGEEVARANAAVSRPEQVRRFAVLPHDLTVEADELTATLKVRRAVVIDRHRPLLEALYTEPA